MDQSQRQPLLRTGSDGAQTAPRYDAPVLHRESLSTRDILMSRLGYKPLLFEEDENQRSLLTSSPGTLLKRRSVANQTTEQEKSWIPSPGSIRGSVFNLAGATLGAGALSLPYAFAVSGVTFAIAQLVIASLLTVYTIRLLIHAGEKTGLKSYEDLALYCFGKAGTIFIAVNILVFCFSIAVAYLVTLGDIITPLGAELFGEKSILSERWLLMSGFCFLIMMPLSLLRDISSLQTSSTLGVLSIIFMVISVSARSISIVQHSGVHPTVEWGFNVEKGVECILGVPIVMFAFTCQVNVFSIYTELQRPNVRRMNKVVDRATAISFIVYFAIGLCGYLAFGNSLTSAEAKGNILLSFSRKDILIAFCRAAITFTVAVAFPLNIFPCRFTIEVMCFSNWPESTLRHVLLSVSLVLSALAVAIFCPSINVVFGMIGGTCSAIVCFAVPAAYMLKLERKPVCSVAMLPHTLLLVSACLLGLFSTAITIWSTAKN